MSSEGGESKSSASNAWKKGKSKKSDGRKSASTGRVVKAKASSRGNNKRSSSSGFSLFGDEASSSAAKRG